ncbi:WxL domain-containing protein [Levilactobacillus enshiensis]|uniref:WxL domain-containing protein n=1 Tax=Levilactobacillus enshiensis TaxID=2590213 RepID=UPI00117AEB5C|nr:WxL domain-containing protein [Levilactobacillus enshiensis]
MTRKLKVSLFSSLAVLSLGAGLLAAAPVSAATTDTSSSSSTATTTSISSSTSSSSAVTTQSTTTSAEFDTSPNATISLDTAPNISFGKNVTPNGKTNGSFYAVSADNPVEVSNPGLGSGWNVQLKNTPFTDAAGDTLSGAQLTLGTPEVAAANTGNPSAAPVATSTPLNGSGTSQIVLAAPARGGLGIWDSEYGLAKINLTVPAGQVSGIYSSTLTWQLSDTPQ